MQGLLLVQRGSLPARRREGGRHRRLETFQLGGLTLPSLSGCVAVRREERGCLGRDAAPGLGGVHRALPGAAAACVALKRPELAVGDLTED